MMSEQGVKILDDGLRYDWGVFWRDKRKDERTKLNWKIRNRGQSRRVYISWDECCITDDPIRYEFF